MARCEDFPCCGHESGCCPDFDENGDQINMRCTCGAKVPVTSRYSLCNGCLHDDEGEPNYNPEDEGEYDDEEHDDYAHERWAELKYESQYEDYGYFE